MSPPRWCVSAAAVWVVLAVAAVASVSAETRSRLWVVQPPGAMVPVDPADFTAGPPVEIPPSAFLDPRRLRINHRGRMLVLLEDGAVWTWDGTAGTNWGPSPEPRPGTAPGAESRTSHGWLLAAREDLLFLAENDFSVETHPEHGYEVAVTTRFHLERWSLAGGPRDRLMDQSFDPCSCATGACSETCPEAEAWAPDGVVDDFLFVKHWVPGQLGPAYGPSFLFRRGAQGWQPTPIARTVEQFLDAADGGSMWIEVECDAGCCGWSNESSDRTALVTAGRTRVLFDEWSRYHNRDYDVSFFTSNARIAPDRRHVAFTIRATEPAGAELRPSSEGHPDSLVLVAIQRTLADLPMVEVQEAGRDSPVLQRVPHAELVGWTGASELLIVERGRLVALDVSTGRRRESDIRVRNAGDAIVTRP